MKTRLLRILFVGIIFILIGYVGCNKSSGPTADNTATFSGIGSDYFPFSGDQTIVGKATGQTNYYDSLGIVVKSESVNQQQFKGYIGSAVTLGGLQAYKLSYFNTDGTTLSPSEIYIAQNKQALVGFSSKASISQLVTVLPSEFQIGTTWVANPTDPLNKEVTLKIVDSKSSYTNSAGKAYSNVIEVNGVLLDSVSESSSGYSSLYKIEADVNLYFAKGVGFIDSQINKYEITYKVLYIFNYGYPNYTPHIYTYYYHRVTSGTIGRTN